MLFASGMKPGFFMAGTWFFIYEEMGLFTNI
jgi:hypothetical protein